VSSGGDGELREERDREEEEEEERGEKKENGGPTFGGGKWRASRNGGWEGEFGGA
jgi:hypothetical protein